MLGMAWVRRQGKWEGIKAGAPILLIVMVEKLLLGLEKRLGCG